MEIAGTWGWGVEGEEYWVGCKNNYIANVFNVNLRLTVVYSASCVSERNYNSSGMQLRVWHQVLV